jgi:hypothetical protein
MPFHDTQKFSVQTHKKAHENGCQKVSIRELVKAQLVQEERDLDRLDDISRRGYQEEITKQKNRRRYLLRPDIENTRQDFLKGLFGHLRLKINQAPLHPFLEGNVFDQRNNGISHLFFQNIIQQLDSISHRILCSGSYILVSLCDIFPRINQT